MRDCDYDFYYTQDGSVGLYSYADEDVYHSKFGALSEAWDKFVIPSGLEKRLNKFPNIRVLDVCYGIGYNTKALMSYVINANEVYLKRNNIKNKIKNFLKKIKNKNVFKNFFKKNFPQKNNSIDSIDTNNIKDKSEEILSAPIETINTHNITLASNGINLLDNNKQLSNSIETVELNYISKVSIDCLEINKELIKISPFIKTFITPQEIFTRIVPKIFDCFDTYWIIKKFLSKMAFWAPRNSQEITELLDIKFNNDYDVPEKEFRIHKFVNYILTNVLINKYNKEYFDEDLKKAISDNRKKRFFESILINYAKFKLFDRYNLLSKLDLSAFLHNIYYDHLSRRYKRVKFEEAEELFNINIYENDARKTILELDGQYDYIYLDAFTFSKAPELWTVEFMAELYRRLSPQGLLMTYSSSALVRNTLLENNFYLGKIYDKKTNKYLGTIAAKEKSMIEHPLSNYELGLCSTKAGIPYRDPNLSSTKEQILKRREIDFKTSDLMTSSQYMRQRMYREGDKQNE